MDIKEIIEALKNRKFPVEFPGHYIGGRWIKEPKAVNFRVAYNPSNGEKIMETALDRSTMEKAIANAVDSERVVADLDIGKRIELLKKIRLGMVELREAFILAMRIGSGKPAWEAKIEFENAVKFLDDTLLEGERVQDRALCIFGREKTRKNIVLQPLGATVAYLPLFTPCTSFVQYISASLLAGCPLILISSAHSVLPGLLYAHLAEVLELPSGTLNVVFGNFEAFMQTLKEKRIQAVFYRGSKEHAISIRRESGMDVGRQLMLVSGGKNSAIIHESVNMANALDYVFWGAFRNAGQLCSATSRVFIHESSLLEFKDGLAEMVNRISVGRTDIDGKDPFMGPLYSKKAVDKFLKFQTMGAREAKETLVWGKVVETDSKGYLVSPGVHILEHFDDNRAYQGTVLMCPDLAVYVYTDLDYAIQCANTTDSPLAVALIGDFNNLDEARKKLIAPNLMINMPTVELSANLPVSGKLNCGGHRITGVSLAFLLTYPQSLQKGDEFSQLFSTWPSP